MNTSARGWVRAPAVSSVTPRHGHMNESNKAGHRVDAACHLDRGMPFKASMDHGERGQTGMLLVGLLADQVRLKASCRAGLA